jgi:hypothetical protein
MILIVPVSDRTITKVMHWSSYWLPSAVWSLVVTVSSVSEEPSGCKSKPDTKVSEKPTAPIINVEEFSIYLERTFRPRPHGRNVWLFPTYLLPFNHEDGGSRIFLHVRTTSPTIDVIPRTHSNFSMSLILSLLDKSRTFEVNLQINYVILGINFQLPAALSANPTPTSTKAKATWPLGNAAETAADGRGCRRKSSALKLGPFS